jgi:hypothetical protein
MRKLGIAAAGLVLAAVSGVAVAALDRGATDVAIDSRTESLRILLDVSADNTDVFT